MRIDLPGPTHLLFLFGKKTLKLTNITPENRPQTEKKKGESLPNIYFLRRIMLVSGRVTTKTSCPSPVPLQRKGGPPHAVFGGHF